MEWTNEQRDAAEVELRRRFSILYAYNEEAILQCELTAALEENARLKAQMGELAVGGAELNEAARLLDHCVKHISTYYASDVRCAEDIRAWLSRNLPAPPSGEQSQVEGFPVEISLGDGFPAQTEVQSPKGEVK